MTSSSSRSFLVPKDNKRKLPRPAGDIRYPFPSLITSPLPGDLLTRSLTYFGLTATRRSSVKLAEFPPSLTIWVTIWTRFRFEKKSHMLHILSRSASMCSSWWGTSLKGSSRSPSVVRGTSRSTLSSSWSALLWPWSSLYGPEKPHLGHLYGRPNPRHFSQRHMVTSPHCGQGNFTASSRGSIMRPHQLHEGILTVRTSVNMTTFASDPF